MILDDQMRQVHPSPAARAPATLPQAATPLSCSALNMDIYPRAPGHQGAAAGPMVSLYCACAAFDAGAPACGLPRRPALRRTARWLSGHATATATAPPHCCQKTTCVRVPPHTTLPCL
jgi:hypothetical protein